MVAFGISILIPIILVRNISPYTYGLYRELLLVFATLNPIFLIGIETSIKYFYPRYGPQKRKSLLTQTTYLLFLSGLFFLLTLMIIGLVGQYFGYGENWNIYFILLGLYAFFNINVAAYVTILVVADKVKFASAIYIIFAIIDVILISLFGIVFKSIIGLLSAMVIADFVKFLIYLYFCKKENIPLFKNIQPKFIKVILAYSIPIGLSNFISIINVSIDKYFIAFYFTPVIYMLYHLGSYQLPPLHMILSSIIKVLVPALSREHKKKRYENIIKLWHETLRKTSILFLPLFAFLMIITNELLIVLFTEQYLAASPVFRIYLFMVLLRIFSFSWLLLATGQAKFLFYLSIGILISNGILNFILLNYIQNIGIESFYGPAIATIIVMYLHTVVCYNKTRKVINQYIDSSLVPWSVIIKIGSITLFASMVTYFSVYWLFYGVLTMFHPVIIVLLSFAIFSICYLGLMFKTKSIREDDIKTLKSFLTGKF